MFDLIVYHAGAAWDGLLNVYLGAPVFLNDVGKAPGHCGVVVNAAAVPASMAMVLVRVHWLGTCQLRWEQTPGHGYTKTAVFCFVGFAVGLLEVGTRVE